jgi:predicted dehydrogenase
MMRVAVCGTGFGCRVHVPALRAAGFDVVALVGQDRDRTARRAERAGVPNACSGVGEALELGVDAVTVATPPHSHAPLVLEAAAAGAHVICEKPFALDASEAEQMCAAVAAAGVVGLVAHEFRFASDRAEVARLIVGGAIGTPRVATLVQHYELVADRGAPVPSWWYDRTKGGGWLFASGSHAIDQVRYWLGDIAAVRAGALLHRGDDADDAFVAQLTTSSGCEVSIVQSASSWGPPRAVAHIAGDLGSVWIDEGVWLADSARPAGELVQAPVMTEKSDNPRHRFTHMELDPFTELCRAFAAAISGGSSGAAATFADGLAAQRVLDAIRTI